MLQRTSLPTTRRFFSRIAFAEKELANNSKDLKKVSDDLSNKTLGAAVAKVQDALGKLADPGSTKLAPSQSLVDQFASRADLVSLARMSENALHEAIDQLTGLITDKDKASKRLLSDRLSKVEQQLQGGPRDDAAANREFAVRIANLEDKPDRIASSDLRDTNLEKKNESSVGSLQMSARLVRIESELAKLTTSTGSKKTTAFQTVVSDAAAAVKKNSG